jgi:hypothetical protein
MHGVSELSIREFDGNAREKIRLANIQHGLPFWGYLKYMQPLNPEQKYQSPNQGCNFAKSQIREFPEI